MYSVVSVHVNLTVVLVIFLINVIFNCSCKIYINYVDYSKKHVLCMCAIFCNLYYTCVHAVMCYTGAL